MVQNINEAGVTGRQTKASRPCGVSNNSEINVCFRPRFDGVFVYMYIKERGAGEIYSRSGEREMGLICEPHTRRGVIAPNCPGVREEGGCFCALFPQNETVTLSSGRPAAFSRL